MIRGLAAVLWQVGREACRLFTLKEEAALVRVAHEAEARSDQLVIEVEQLERELRRRGQLPSSS